MIRDATIGAEASQIPLSFAGVGDNIIVTGLPGKQIKILQFFFVAAAATNITLKSGATALSGQMAFTANMSMFLDFIQLPLTCNPGDNFIINLSAGVQISGTLWFSQI